MRPRVNLRHHHRQQGRGMARDHRLSETPQTRPAPTAESPPPRPETACRWCSSACPRCNSGFICCPTRRTKPWRPKSHDDDAARSSSAAAAAPTIHHFGAQAQGAFPDAVQSDLDPGHPAGDRSPRATTSSRPARCTAAPTTCSRTPSRSSGCRRVSRIRASPRASRR